MHLYFKSRVRECKGHKHARGSRQATVISGKCTGTNDYTQQRTVTR